MTETKSEKINVLLFGLGAIGGFYAFILGRNENVSLSVVARSNFDAVKQNGLQIDSENHGSHKVNIDHVFKSPSDAPFTFDYILCANKAINPEKTPPLFKSCATDKTTFVIAQNGVGNEDPFRAFFPNSTIISCVVWVGGVQKTPGVITHFKSETTEMGLFPNAKVDPSLEKKRLDQFAQLLKNGKTNFTVKEDIQIARWKKVVWNAAWNPFTTLTQVHVQTFLKSTDEAMEMTRQLMREMVAVARRSGVALEDSLPDELIDKVMGYDLLMSSMYVDSQEGRPLEVEVILGTPMRKAKELGMEVPVLQTIYSLTMAVHQRLDR